MYQELQAAFDALEVKACEAENDRVRYERFNDLGENLSPTQYSFLEKQVKVVVSELNHLYFVINEIQFQIVKLNNERADKEENEGAK